MTLYSASRPLPLFAQRALWAAARVTRGRMVLGRPEHWVPPVDEETFASLWAAWCRLAEGPVDGLAVYERMQGTHTSLTVLLCAEHRSMFIRVRRNPADLALESRISEAARARPALQFRVPAILGAGQENGYHWTAYEPMALRPHGPARHAPLELTEQVARLVESVIPRPADVPSHWRGSHGDLTPWNLRRSHTGRWLIDWEDARWAPPGADYVYFAAVRTALNGKRVSRLELADEYREAEQYWAAAIRLRSTVSLEQRLDSRLQTLFGTAREL